MATYTFYEIITRKKHSSAIPRIGGKVRQGELYGKSWVVQKLFQDDGKLSETRIGWNGQVSPRKYYLSKTGCRWSYKRNSPMFAFYFVSHHTPAGILAGHSLQVSTAHFDLFHCDNVQYFSTSSAVFCSISSHSTSSLAVSVIRHLTVRFQATE